MVIMEHVTKVEAILDMLAEFFSMIGYQFHATDKLVPEAFRIPNSRPRFYMFVCRVRCFPILNRSPLPARVDQFVHSMLSDLAPRPMLPVEQFALPDGTTYFDSQAKACAGHEVDEDVGALWPAKHVEVFGRHGQNRPSSAEMRAFRNSLACSVKKWFDSKSQREQEVAYFASVVLEKSGIKSVDLSQCLTRCSPSIGRLNCFTGSSDLWLTAGRRPFSGREQLAMQGISLRSMTEGVDDEVLGTMAGNAFSGPCVMGAISAVLAAISE